jgi:hypothetical protein
VQNRYQAAKRLKRFFFRHRVGRNNMLFKKFSLTVKKPMDQMRREQEVSNLESVKHLSSRLQRKLAKREYRQRKRFRSSGKPYPLAMDMNGDEEELSVPASGYSLTRGQRLALAIASLAMVMLLTFGLAGIAAVMHAANWVGFLILFVAALFTSAAVIINNVFNRKR